MQIVIIRHLFNGCHKSEDSARKPMRRRSSLRVGLLAASTLAFAVSLSHSQSIRISGDQCVEALRIVAKNEYKIEDDKVLDTRFHDAFCDAVKDKKQSKQKTNADALYGAFFLSLSNDESQLSDYERRYCRTTSSSTNFKSSYRFYASVVNPNAASEFNICMDKVRQALGTRGVLAEVKRSDSCHAVVALSYVRPGEDGPLTARVKNVVPYNLACDKFPSQLTASAAPVSCRRIAWGPASLAVGTTQTFPEIELPSENPPAPPSQPVFPQVDARTATAEVIGRYVSGSTAVPGTDGRLTYGTIPLEKGAGNVSVSYTCTGGEGLCGWTFGNYKTGGTHEEKYGPNWQFTSDGNVRWTRWWQGDAKNAITERYTVAYTVPHILTAAEKEQQALYLDQLEKHRTLVSTGPCANEKRVSKPSSR